MTPNLQPEVAVTGYLASGQSVHNTRGFLLHIAAVFPSDMVRLHLAE